MPRKESKLTSKIESGILYTDDEATTGAIVGSAPWFAWLQLGRTFSFRGCTFRSEQRRAGSFWYAYRKIDGKLKKVYVGVPERMSLERLKMVAGMVNGLQPEASGDRLPASK